MSVPSSPPRPPITKNAILGAAAATAMESAVPSGVMNAAGATKRFFGFMWSKAKGAASYAADTGRSLASSAYTATARGMAVTAAKAQAVAHAAWEQMPEGAREHLAEISQNVTTFAREVTTFAAEKAESSGLNAAARRTAELAHSAGALAVQAVKATVSGATGLAKVAGSAMAAGAGRAAQALTPARVTALIAQSARGLDGLEEILEMVNDPAADCMTLSEPPFPAAAEVPLNEMKAEQLQLWKTVSMQSSQFAALFAGARAGAGEALSTQDVWDCFKAAAAGYVRWNGWRKLQNQLQSNSTDPRPAVVPGWDALSPEQKEAQISERCQLLLDQMLQEKYTASWVHRDAAAAAYGTTSNYMTRLMERFTDKLLPALEQLNTDAGTQSVVSIIQQLVTALAHKMESYHDVAARLAAGEQFVDEVSGAILTGNIQEVMAKVLSSSRYNRGISAAERERLVGDYAIQEWVPDLISASSWFEERLHPHFDGPWWHQLGQALIYILTAPFLATAWAVSRVVELIVNPILKRKILNAIHTSRAIPEALKAVREAMVPAAQAPQEGDPISRMSQTMKKVMTKALRKGSWKLYNLLQKNKRENNPEALIGSDRQARKDKPSNLHPQVREDARKLMRDLLNSLKIQNASTQEDLQAAANSAQQPESLGRAAQAMKDLFGFSVDEKITDLLVEHSDQVVEILVECLLEDPSYILTAVNESLRAVTEIFNPESREPLPQDAIQVEKEFDEALNEMQKQLGWFAADLILTNPAIGQRRDLIALNEFAQNGVEVLAAGDAHATLQQKFPALTVAADEWLADHAACKLDALHATVVQGLKEECPQETTQAEQVDRLLSAFKSGMQKVSALGHLGAQLISIQTSVGPLLESQESAMRAIQNLSEQLALHLPISPATLENSHQQVLARTTASTEEASKLMRELATLSGQTERVNASGLNLEGLNRAKQDLADKIRAVNSAKEQLEQVDGASLGQRRRLESLALHLETYTIVQKYSPLILGLQNLGRQLDLADQAVDELAAVQAEEAQNQNILTQSLKKSLLGSILRSLPIPKEQADRLADLPEWAALTSGPVDAAEELRLGAQDVAAMKEALFQSALWQQIVEIPGVQNAVEHLDDRLNAVRAPSLDEARRALYKAVRGFDLPVANQGEAEQIFQDLQGGVLACLVGAQPMTQGQVVAFLAAAEQLSLVRSSRDERARALQSQAVLSNALKDLQESVAAVRDAVEATSSVQGAGFEDRLIAEMATVVSELGQVQVDLGGAVGSVAQPVATLLERKNVMLGDWNLPADVFFGHLAKRLAPADAVNETQQREALRNRVKTVLASTISKLADRKIRPLLGVTHNGALFSTVIDTGMAALANYQATRSGQMPSPAPYADAALRSIQPIASAAVA